MTATAAGRPTAEPPAGAALLDAPAADAPDAAQTDAEVLDALAAGLRGWIDRITAAETRLADFAFREDGPTIDLAATTSHRYFIGRILGAAADPAVLRLLEAVRGDGASLAELARRGDLGPEPGDRIALGERIADAAAAGLVARELDGDRVASTPLGSAVVDLVEALEARLRSDDAAAAGGPAATSTTPPAQATPR